MQLNAIRSSLRRQNLPYLTSHYLVMTYHLRIILHKSPETESMIVVEGRAQVGLKLSQDHRTRMRRPILAITNRHHHHQLATRARFDGSGMEWS